MDLFNSTDNMMSFVFGILLVMAFWLSFSPKYVIVKNISK